jgi:acetyltransferase-like isoleucine patch superfamily enzyme
MLISLFLPWCLRRPILCALGFKLHPTSRIGLSLILADHLIMEANSRIGNLTVCKNIQKLHLAEYATIGNLNWITGYPAGGTKHFTHQENRKPELILDVHASITNRHLIDCTNSISIGSFTIVAGFQSQMITHSIDLQECRQSSNPISIGKYCFVGSNSVLLGGSVLPDYSVLGANSFLSKAFTESYYLYAGVPARPVKQLPHDYKYFQRQVGFVN